MSALALTPLLWPAVDLGRRWACHTLAVLADEHHAAARAHRQLTDLLDTLDHRLDPHGLDELADRLAAIDRAAVTGHDHVHLHQLLNQHGHHDVSACLDRAGRHLLDALHTLRRLADHARRGHTPTELRRHLARTLADLDAAGTQIATADRALIHQLKEVIDYPE